jgi:hypothetical protein
MAEEKKVPEVDNAPAPAGTTVVAGVGRTTHPRGRGVLGRMIQEAMSKAVLDAQAEAKAIWEEGGPPTTDEQRIEKQKKIDAIASDDAIRDRMIAARKAVKAREGGRS